MRHLPTRPLLDAEAAAPNAPDVAPDTALDAAGAACAGCPGPALPERRRLLRDALAAAAGALVSLGVSRAAAAAMPLRAVSGVRGRDDVARYPIPAADGASIDRAQEVILVRWQNAVYAFALACPHQNTALRWLEKDGRFQCPKHKSKYRPDGSFIEGRATRGLDRFTVTRDGASIAVHLTALHKQDADPAGWSAAVLRLA